MRNKDVFIKVLIVFSLVGLVTSLYLVQSHLSPPSEGSFCDVGETVSCSIVNTSTFSEVLDVPVAIFGAIWFIFLILFLWKELNDKTGVFSLALLAWTSLGLLSVVYLVVAEIILEALCPLCTIVHVIVIISFILSVIMYRKAPKPKSWKKKLMPWIIGIAIINLIPFIIFNLPDKDQANLDNLAKCINEKEINMYGSFRCGSCAKTRKMFGESFQYINEIECHPQGHNSQFELCSEKKIDGTPTFILEPDGEEVKRIVGFHDIEQLKEFSGCE